MCYYQVQIKTLINAFGYIYNQKEEQNLKHSSNQSVTAKLLCIVLYQIQPMFNSQV